MHRIALIALLSVSCQTRVDAFHFPDAGGSALLAPSWHATFVQRNGTVFGWGDGRVLQGSPTSRPRSFGALDYVQLVSGDASWCGLDRAGAVFCQGDNLQGELGTGDTLPRTAQTRVALPGPARRIALTHWHTCALLNDDSLYCWGWNNERQVSSTVTAQEPTPTKVPGSYRDVDVGDGHTCALTLAQEPFCWGRNNDGQLGTGPGSPVQQAQATLVPGGLRFSMIRTSMLSTCGLEVGSGGLWCFGRRIHEVGGSGATDPSPVRIENTGSWTDFSVSAFHLCARREDRSLWCVGRNLEGQLGLGDETLRPQLVKVADGVDAVKLGRFHTCLSAGASLRCAGRNDEAQLGVGDKANRNEFVPPQFP